MGVLGRLFFGPRHDGMVDRVLGRPSPPPVPSILALDLIGIQSRRRHQACGHVNVLGADVLGG